MNKESFWLREARRYWWKSRREKSEPYRVLWEREAWRLLFIEAGAPPWMAERPSAQEIRRRDAREHRHSRKNP